MARASAPPAASELVAHAGFAAVALLLLVAAGQPIFTDDAWWHLALGEAYAQHGPWLSEDPLLFTAPGPPAPAAWLADLMLFAGWRGLGFLGLRIAHVAAVAAALALAWSLLRRASGSAAAASLGALGFAALAAYRVVQLRPELLTILATLALYRLLVEGGAAPSARRIAVAALLLAVWANCHAGFPLGLLLIGSCLAGVLLAMPLRPVAQRAGDRARALRLGLALGAGFLATLVNPMGVGAHLAGLAGGDTPELTRVADEWAPLAPLRLPVPQLPPSPLAWGLAWLLLAATPCAAVVAARRWRAAHGREPQGADPALLAWSAASLLALLAAVRFLWLGLFPLLLLAQCGAGRRAPRAVALAALLLLPGFVRLGDWPMISGSLPRSLAGYREPYAAAKYYAHPVGWLVDTGVEGHVFADYPQAGFLGFFGAPALRSFVNGSLNVTRDVMEANRAIRERRGERPGEGFLALLERMQVDVFLGTRLPRLGARHRPRVYTTAHLEGAPGWLCVFRNVDSAVYLRANERNRENLARIAAWYARERVPFDPQRGFEVPQVVRQARAFAISHGVVPVHFEALAAAARARDPGIRRSAWEQEAPLYAALGLYERALELDRRTLREDPDAWAARRRVVWSLLRLRRAAEALEEAAELERRARGDWLSRELAEAARRVAEADADEADAIIVRLPVLTADEAALVMQGLVAPEARLRRSAAVPRAQPR